MAVQRLKSGFKFLALVPRDMTNIVSKYSVREPQWDKWRDGIQRRLKPIFQRTIERKIQGTIVNLMRFYTYTYIFNVQFIKISLFNTENCRTKIQTLLNTKYYSYYNKICQFYFHKIYTYIPGNIHLGIHTTRGMEGKLNFSYSPLHKALPKSS